MHHLVDGRGRPLVVAVGPGQCHDGPILPHLLEAVRVPRRGPGRPRTRPDALLADKAYSSRATRRRLRERRITTVIPEPHLGAHLLGDPADRVLGDRRRTPR